MLAFIILALLLLQFSRRQQSVQKEKPLLAILLDKSASMTDNPLEEKLSRADKAIALLKSSKLKKELAAFNVDFFAFGTELQEDFDIAEKQHFTDSATNLLPAINKLHDRLKTQALSGILLLSDGLDQSVAELQSRAKQIPIIIPELEQQPAKDLYFNEEDYAIHSLNYPEKALLNWEVKIESLIKREQSSEKVSFPVQLIHNEKVLQSINLEFAENEKFARVGFSFTPEQLGDQLFSLKILPETDVDFSNNSKEFVINVSDEQKGILYLEGTARWEFKYLKRILSAEKSQQLNTFLQSGMGIYLNFATDGGTDRQVSLPKFDAEFLRNYKIVILGDLLQDSLQKEDYLALNDFVEKGGAILFLTGNNSASSEGIFNSPDLMELFPVSSLPEAEMREGRFSVDFTAAGRAQSAFSSLGGSSRLPPLLSFWGPVKSNPFASVFLATSDNSPILVARRFGRGRTAILLSDSFWRWQLAPERGFDEDLYSKFMLQLLNWLSPANQNEINPDQLTIMLLSRETELHSKVTVAAVGTSQNESATPVCRIISPAGSSTVIPFIRTELGDEYQVPSSAEGYKCEFVPDEQGIYQLQALSSDGLQSDTALLQVKRAEKEFTGEIINRELLKKIAEESNGEFVKIDSKEALLKKINKKGKEIEVVREYPLWNRWYWIATLLILFYTEWALRKKYDLI